MPDNKNDEFVKKIKQDNIKFYIKGERAVLSHLSTYIDTCEANGMEPKLRDIKDIINYMSASIETNERQLKD